MEEELRYYNSNLIFFNSFYFIACFLGTILAFPTFGLIQCTEHIHPGDFITFTQFNILPKSFSRFRRYSGCEN